MASRVAPVIQVTSEGPRMIQGMLQMLGLRRAPIKLLRQGAPLGGGCAPKHLQRLLAPFEGR
eukprot:9137998-Alexandrium_andersonii.AAC.1